MWWSHPSPTKVPEAYVLQVVFGVNCNTARHEYAEHTACETHVHVVGHGLGCKLVREPGSLLVWRTSLGYHITNDIHKYIVNYIVTNFTYILKTVTWQ